MLGSGGRGGKGGNASLLRRVVHLAPEAALCRRPLLPATMGVAQEVLPPRCPESLMHARLPGSRWVVLAALTASLLPLLAGCGPARNQFAPVCPNQAIL